MILIRPTKEDIEKYINAPIPKKARNEWDNDHKEFVLKTWLPKLKLSIRLQKIVIEAYLTEFFLEKEGATKPFEQVICDGSSVVPDLAYNWGEIKDPWAMAHDFIFFMHRLGLRDAYGKKWTFMEANLAYKEGWIAQKNYLVANVYFWGLTIFGAPAWFKKFNNKPEPITSII